MQTPDRVFAAGVAFDRAAKERSIVRAYKVAVATRYRGGR